MCYELDEMYWKARQADEARRKKAADDSKDKPSAPAKPAAPEVKPREPVPAYSRSEFHRKPRPDGSGFVR
jgi:hypothetical protein